MISNDVRLVELFHATAISRGSIYVPFHAERMQKFKQNIKKIILA